MIFTVILFAMETYASRGRDVAPWWLEYSNEHTTKASPSTHWWERYTETTASEAWWNKFTTKITEATISIPLDKLLVPLANFTLTPFQAIKMMEEPDLLNNAIAYHVQQFFGEEKPEMYGIVAKWLSSHINRTLENYYSKTKTRRENTYEMKTPLTTPQWPELETTWKTAEPVWTLPAEEIEYKTDITDNGPTESIVPDSGTEQAIVTEPVSSDTGQDLVNETDLDTGQGDLVTRHTDLVTGQTDLGNVQMEYGTEQTVLGTAQMELGTDPRATGYEGTTDHGEFTEIIHEITSAPNIQPEDTTKTRPEPSYIDSFGRPVTIRTRFRRPQSLQSYDGLRESGSRSPPAPQGHQDNTPEHQQNAQGHQPQGPMGLTKKLPFVITPRKESPVTETTTVLTTEAITEVTTRHEYFGKQIIDYNDLLDRPDYEDMAGYISGRPDLVNEGTTIMVLWGIVSSTTTTEHPLILTIKKDMADSKNGYFTSFFKKMLELLATMEREQAGYLFAAADIVSNDMDREGLLRFLGMPLQPAWLRVTSVLASIPPEVAQSKAVIAHKALSDPSILPAEIHRIFKIVDSIYNMKEGDVLFASLVDVEGYPENNITSRKVMRKVINAVLQPFNRLKGTPRLNTILNRLNEAISENYPYRRSDKSKDRDFALHKINLIKPQKNANLLKSHLKNKHRDINKNDRYRYTVSVKERNEPKGIFGGFKNRFLKEQGIDRKVEFIREILMSEKKMPQKPQTRFNIIHKAEGQSGGKPYSNIAKINKTETSKYLSHYKLKTKPNRNQDKKVHAKREDMTSEERDLKFNLQDTLRHGDRKFVERNYETRNKDIIHDLSSYSDEEGVLKNNIYKVFGYTQRFF